MQSRSFLPIEFRCEHQQAAHGNREYHNSQNEQYEKSFVVHEG